MGKNNPAREYIDNFYRDSRRDEAREAKREPKKIKNVWTGEKGVNK